MVVLVVGVTVLAIAFGFDVSVPESIEGRVEQTFQRYESGNIDARVLKFEQGLELFNEKPMIGYGYNSGRVAHNSYLNILIDTGIVGFVICLFVFIRSAMILKNAGRKCRMLFLIGAGGLLVHAIFESQNTPGQASFIPLLTWLALTRSRYVLGVAKSRGKNGVQEQNRAKVLP